MPTLYSLALTFMCSLSVLSAVLSMQCKKFQYPWPRNNHELCCDGCPPGKRMIQRSQTTCEIQCVTCADGQYRDTPNAELTCKWCRRCRESNMEEKSRCNSTHNAVCTCKVGYRCIDQPCSKCVKIPTTVAMTPPLSTLITTIGDKLPPTSTTTTDRQPLHKGRIYYCFYTR
ncbi:CD27 antigen [Xyrichtys novacula]|uniref:CD27 antigen n=1 Tax=Xyrichtys novacula TaxID=13765 RepID=A0AAV1FNG0_XYRNO|nr:CD27 antigen [Xyrichtys novacula]